MESLRVPGFLPHQSAFHFANDFASQPLMRLGPLSVGNAANGLCGGMVFAARDLHDQHLAPPPDTVAPGRGSPWFRYLVRRLFASFDLPAGPLRYLLWMVLPGGNVTIVRGLAWRTVHRHWPAIKADLDRGRLSPLGLVRTRSFNPLDLGRNHQVLAFGYDLDGAALTVHVYDPNHPDDDTRALRVDLSTPAGPTPISYIEGERPVRGFFRTRYRPGRPPAV